MRSTPPAARRIERTATLPRTCPPVQNLAKGASETQSRLNTIEANQPVATAIIAVAKP
jgi:hypothetical protein